MNEESLGFCTAGPEKPFEDVSLGTRGNGDDGEHEMAPSGMNHVSGSPPRSQIDLKGHYLQPRCVVELMHPPQTRCTLTL